MLAPDQPWESLSIESASVVYSQEEKFRDKFITLRVYGNNSVVYGASFGG